MQTPVVFFFFFFFYIKSGVDGVCISWTCFPDVYSNGCWRSGRPIRAIHFVPANVHKISYSAVNFYQNTKIRNTPYVSLTHR